MELDDLKAAWNTLDQRLQRQHALDLHLFRQDKVERIHSSLRPLFWGQILQMLFGLGFIVLAALLWIGKPHGFAMIAAGVTVHAYGVACIILAGMTLGGISGIDHASATLENQKQLARLRRTYIISGMVAGLPWWFLWVPILMVLAGLAGVDVYAQSPATVWFGMAIGAVGLVGTWWFHHWARDPRRPRLARAMDNAVTGSSLRKAQAQLEALKHFELE